MCDHTVICLIIIIGCLLLGAQCSSNENKALWVSHSHLVYSFKCQNPQARSFELTELLDPNDSLLLDIENVYPSSTVLHRCENAGCCSGASQCAPIQIETLNLIFGVVQPNLSKVQYVHRDVDNHTLCSCQSDIRKSLR